MMDLCGKVRERAGTGGKGQVEVKHSRPKHEKIVARTEKDGKDGKVGEACSTEFRGAN
jgi:hypothetical protein